ncbi:MAG: 4Fe-4S dicluster domain-containing protein [Deltaproteobacteria bacterium]|nr:4Fe-4S dicluster domain-containing protein [Deltaproteobacteria bacterium]
MKFQTISCICFSPTGTTKIIAEHIAKGMGAERIEMMDCTKRSEREKLKGAFKDDPVILATPVYYGRVPEEIAPFFAKLSAQKTPVVLAVVYGNREYEDALKELHDIAVADGFIPVAGGAFIAENSYSTADRPIAQGRPDADDLAKVEAFGARVREKFELLDSPDSADALKVPGNVPYVTHQNLLMIKEARKSVPLTPETDAELCTQCGRCVEVCPSGTVSLDEEVLTDRWRCSICFACIRNCPTGARQMTEPNFAKAIQQLAGICRERKEPEFFSNRSPFPEPFGPGSGPRGFGLRIAQRP